MSVIVPALQAIVREELGAARAIELGIVTQAYTNEGGSGDTNLAVDVRLRGSALELQHVPVAVGRLGVSMAPRVGDMALLGFVGGDVNGAVVIGFLYDEQTRPPDGKATELVYKVPDDEQEGDRRLALELPNGNKLTVEDKKVTVAMGSTTLTIEADGAVTVEAGGDLSLQAKGDVKVKAQGGVTIEATAAASLKGASVAIEGQGEAKLKGATTTIAGMTSFSAA
jgi:uncharacterized protein involved in type VI secretion and phage assembly